MNMKNINIEEIMYKWFEMKLKTYDRLEYDDSIYLYYEGEEYANIVIDKRDKYIYYIRKLHDEFSEIIPIQKNVFQKFMSKWVEDIFNLKGFTPLHHGTGARSLLKIPKINN